MAITASTFARVTSVLVDPFQTTTDTGLYPDASLLPGSTSASTVVPINGVTATVGQMWRGMPAYVNTSTNRIVAPNAASATSVFVGVLVDDLTAYVVARGTKITFAKRGRVRTYAGASLIVGQPVKPDTGAANSGNFAGFIPWVDGTDSVQLLAGRAYPLDDGSAGNGAPSASTMAQGDTIFLDLNPIG